jgi:HSP20 family protein
MALTFWDPFSMLSRLDREFDDLVRRTWGTGSGAGAGTAGYVPAVEMATDGEDVLLRLELPGVDVEKDVDIEVAEGRLTISGRRSDRYESGNGKGQVLVRELRYGQFRRDFALPEGVTADDVDASYDRGMLEVRVRRVAKPVAAPKKVAIKGAAQPRTIEAGQADS